MEELLAAILGALLEILVEVLASVPVDAWVAALERRRTKPGAPLVRSLWGLVLIGTTLGLIMGGISLGIHRAAVLPVAWLRIVNLLAAPIFSGLLARSAAVRRIARGDPSSPPRHHFWFAYVFTLAIVVVRFAYGIRSK
jgi:hypothetical protein